MPPDPTRTSDNGGASAPAAATGSTARILAQVSDAYVLMDRDFRVVAVNPAAERLLGREADTLLGRTHWELFPASVGTEVERRYRRVAAEGVEERFAHHHVGDGYDWHLEIDAYPTEDAGVAVFWRDVSEQVRAAAALARQSRLTRLVADNATSALFVMDRDGHPTYMNRAAEAMTGFTLGEIAWMPLHYAVHHRRPDGSLYPMAECPIDRALPENNDVRAHADLFVRKDGTFFPVLCAASPIVEGGVPVGTVVEVRDVTEERRAAAALRALNDALAERNERLEDQGLELELTNQQLQEQAVELKHQTDEARALTAELERANALLQSAVADAEQARRDAQTADRAKSDFLATMSHEVRTPINAIQGYTQLLELGIGGPVTEQQRDYLERLAASSQHLLGLVDDVLDLAKIEAGEFAVARERVSTARAVGAALDLVGPQAAARGVRLVDRGADAPLAGAATWATSTACGRCCLNLLSNAVKFTEPGGTVTVEVGTATEARTEAGGLPGGPWTVVRVVDTGVGIDPRHQAAVFEPFHQVEGGHTRTRGGTWARARDQPAARAAHGRGGHARERARRGLDLHALAPGRRRRPHR
jgi:PAS domain S-box-containing protein